MHTVSVFHLSRLASLWFKALWILHPPISGTQALSPECSLCSEHCLVTCSQGFYFSSGLCAECPVGYYCPGNVSAPRKCPVGTYNYHTRREGIQDCQPCPPSSISSEDGASCRPCPAGMSCDLTTGTIMPCAPGQHSPEGLTTCLPCPSGSTCPDGHQRKEVTVPVQGLLSPYLVPSGSTHPTLARRSVRAVMGHLTVGARWGLFGIGLRDPWSSEPGFQAPVSQGHTGTRKRGWGQPAQLVLWVITALGVWLSHVQQEEGSARRPGSQFMCQQGYYCEEGTGVPHGTPCPVGTAGGQLAQTTRASCKRCAEGRFCPAGSVLPGLPCARGSFCPAGTLEEVSCPKGTFTPHQGAASVKDCLKCPAGFYCPEGTRDPLPCQPGTFNPLEGQDEPADCRPCYPGKACTQVALKGPDVDCMQGFVCPPGSSRPNPPGSACPPGTLSNRTSLTDRSQCQQCPPRYACLRGTGGVQRPPLACFPGHFCPPGTMYPTQHKCPAGTWSERSGMQSERECQPCPPGWYCLPGAGVPSGRCSSGHYCPEGTQYSSQYPCQPGTYSTKMGNGQREDCQFCPEGYYCLEGTSKPAPCPPTTFRRLKGGQQAQDCITCPAGYSCPHPATISPQTCGAGSYSDEGSVECSPCLQGHYCSDETTSEEAMLRVMICPPASCALRAWPGNPSALPPSAPVGFYCPGGSINPNPIPCPNGTFSGQPGLRDVTECVVCPEGHFCFSERPQDHPISEPTGRCPDGHRCPPGTGHPLSFPCQAGFFRNDSFGHRGALCVPCPAGYLCSSPAVHTPSVCPEGYFCAGGSMAPEPCEEGTYSPRPALRNASECSPCGGGRYCSGVGQTVPSGDCREGFYCRERAISATPADGPTGGLCPAGSFCPTGSPAPTPCPPGTFSNSTGLTGIQQCVNCLQGYYCSGSNSTAPTGPCFAGHYCPTGSASPTQFEVEEGQYSPPGAARAQLCPLGTFQPARGQASCLACERGRFCNRTGLAHPTLCPPGHYCPTGTSVPRPCPPGSYLAQRGGEEVQHCGACDAGSFCRSPGLSAPQGPCEPGFFCSGGANTASPVNTSTGGVCPAGCYCPLGTRHPQEYPCPPGTWSNALGAQDASSCWFCPAGFFCNGAGLSQPSGPCAPGFFCMGGADSSTPDDGVTGQRCPMGFYCPKGSTAPLKCASRCMDCPSGHYCTEADGVQFCPEGHFCPGGTGEDILPCPPGSYGPQPGQSYLDQCLLCPAGMYCEEWGLSEPSGPCESGYFCLADSMLRTALAVALVLPASSVALRGPEAGGGVCPVAHYCPPGSATPIPCPAGTYANLTGQANCSHCHAGYYCPGRISNYTRFPCPAGFYCPDGTRHATQYPCPRGYYNPETMTQSLDSCLPCPPGHYCEKERLTDVSGKCKAGWFCVSAAWNSQPFDLDNYTNANCLCPATSTGGRCQEGYYCPAGSPEPLPCPPGAFCNVTGEGSGEPRLCPAGSFSPVAGISSEARCQLCMAGSYCSSPGLRAPTGPCNEGYWCPPGQTVGVAKPCPGGHYCPAGSPAPIPCPAGLYQDREKQAACLPCEPVNGTNPQPCPRGHYCPGGSGMATQFGCPTGTFNPREGVISVDDCISCPPGKFCSAVGLSEPGGTVAPVPCPQGTWWNRTGCKSPEECQPCPGGSYCDSPGLSTPSGPCSAGFYCTERAVTPAPSDNMTGGRCPEQHYCPIGTRQPILCEPGTFITVTQATACWPCPPGRYCVEGTIQLCPTGFYCPEGSGYDWMACPEGTYGADAGLAAISQCRECDPGHYCGQRNATAVTGPCQEGYYCSRGNISPQPYSHSAGEGSPCPAGHYCPRGAAEPQPCPEGTFSNLTRLVSEADCTPCSPGRYCHASGLTAPSGECWEGFFCHRGAVLPNSPIRDGRGGPCPPGYFCPKGVAAPQVCPEGSFSTGEGQAVCSHCPRGYYCPGNGSSYQDNECATGHYCPLGSSSKYQDPCPAGTFNPHTRMGHLEDCLPCSPGFFCSSPGLSAASGPCIAGHFCVSGATTPSPEDGKAGDRCPRGHYCPEGSRSPKPCPAGHYSNTSGNTELTHCLHCPAGFSCASSGLSAPSNRCQAGYYCPLGQNSSSPASYTCSPGHRCLPGSAIQSPCAPGTYQDQPGQADCAPCPAGHFCTGSSHPDPGHTPSPCPKGHYCPPGAKSGAEFPCPAGTFSDQTGVSSADQCAPCPPGKYCSSAGLAAPTGHCSAGYLCIHGAVVPQPAGDASGRRCSSGTYCPQGSINMVPCPPGTYNPLEGTGSVDACLPCPRGQYCAGIGLDSPSGSCSPGHYCTLGSSSAEPQNLLTVSTTHASNLSEENGGGVCPKGHYCPATSTQPLPCPPGTFLSKYGARSESECESCPPAFYCPEWGQSSAELECPEGWFCPAGSASGQLSEHRCPEGHACPSGSVQPAVCPPGTHQPLLAQSTCSPCPPAGTMGQTEGLHSQQYCTPCPNGAYCNGSALTTPTGPCTAGHYCTLGAVEPAPVSQDYGDVCPPGHYCPQGSSSPVPCPMGTYLPNTGAPFPSFCTPCPPGHYCDSVGATQPSGLCSPGHYCTEGAGTATPQASSSDLGCSCDVILKAANNVPSLCSWGQNATCQFQNAGYEKKMGRNTQALPYPGNPQNDMDITCASFKGDICPQGSPGGSALEDCPPCPSGQYCSQSGLVVPSGPCAAGHYCPGGQATGRPSQHACTAGHFCEEGSTREAACSPGTYQPSVGQKECELCPAGFVCPKEGNISPTGPCSAGFLCFGGSPLPSPNDKVTGAQCPPGFYCPVGSSTPRPCPKGTFSPGHYCESGTATPTPCPAGTHRPGSGGQRIGDCTACPAGWFQAQEGQMECTACPPGFHCPPPSQGSGTANAPLPCPVGYFCPHESPPGGPAPCPKGTYSSAQGLSAAGECLACPEGYFCGSEGLVQPTGRCTSGFLCYGGAQVPTPTDLQTGSPCPRGAFCQQGILTGLCSAGYYCDRGSSSPEPALCPAGSYCPRGTNAPVPCPPGTFSPGRGSAGQDDCTACPASHFCQGEGVIQPESCPAGHYCPPGVTMGTEFPCPPGTMRSQPGGAGLEDCQLCPAGMFCALHGLAQPTGPCQAGFHCRPGASSPNSTGSMVRSAANALCPPGHYCPAGEGYPLPCPPGSYSSSVGLRRAGQCQACPAGHYCDRPALTHVSQAALCDTGYVCLGGSVTPRPSDGLQGYLCPRGFHCPIGTPTQVPCEPGSYGPAPGAALCTPCPPGTVCPSPATQEPSTCPAGHYCEGGTALAQACPAGTLSELTGAQSVSACVPCPAGMYCSTPGSLQPQGQCQAGYFCQGGATDAAPQSSASFPRNGPCPLGHYCPAGTPSPLPCPTGSVRNHTGGYRTESCLPCPSGQYCASEGQESPSGLCSAGFYCPPNFSSTSPLAFLCPKGHYCTEGSGHPLPCPTGEYQPNPGASGCIPCRPGFYCEEAIAGDPWPCPAHSYCPAATMVPVPCPNGTFTPPDLRGLHEEGECLPCPPGRFCRAGRILGRCAAGFLCFSGSSEATPQGPPLQDWSQCRRGVQCAGPCPAGFYCVEGAEEPLACPSHTVRTTPGATSRQDCLPCPPQHWCREGDPTLHLCPAGHYCDGLGEGETEGGAGPKECPLFTYRTTPGAGNRGDCHPCPAGSFCNDTAGTMRPLPRAVSPGQCVPCEAGTYCPDPRSTGQPNIHGTPCRSAFQCPAGSMMETPCQAGSYCGPGTGEPIPCPGGFICPEGSDTYNSPQQVCV
ncbi:hypothetical protein SKAU_G00082720 [Synaphobranchus kaupii]|uniref:Tyrosine-protein kinase ephrin type A/B receptor-like domain-containing protein n=1 Tax=Synaphobranchus kaupii TaxID=118154 RepID=A0A9Q1FUT5_SYNKA|nr:hypothetical protein SKAU_G00082720 [Synaphobranchus kaupii]